MRCLFHLEIIGVVVVVIVEYPDPIEAAGSDHVVEVVRNQVWSVADQPAK